MRRRVAVGLDLTLLATVVTAQQPSLRQEAKEHDVTQVIINDYSPATLQLVESEADTIVLGVVEFGKAVLSKDERELFTYYHVAIQEVLKAPQASGLTVGDAVTVRRSGGP